MPPGSGFVPSSASCWAVGEVECEQGSGTSIPLSHSSPSVPSLQVFKPFSFCGF